MEQYLYIALFAPLVGSLISALFSNTPKKLIIGIFSSLLLAVSLIASLNLLYHVYTTGQTVHVNMMDWIVIRKCKYPFWIYC